jgi:hypothetical protein
MTKDQKAWIDAHPEYSIVGRKAGQADYSGSLTLMPDGATRKRKHGEPVPAGAFDVAILHPEGTRRDAPPPPPRAGAGWQTGVSGENRAFTGAPIDPKTGNLQDE